MVDTTAEFETLGQSGAHGSRVAALLGCAPRAWTVEAFVDLVQERRIPLVALMHVGADARLKTLDFAPTGPGHLHDILSAGERVDGSSLFGAMGIPTRASDITLRPRLATAFLDPFAEQPTLAFLCTHHGRDGSLLAESPGTLVLRAHERCCAETGVELHALLELEYFLGKPHEEGDLRCADDLGYHATSPLVFGQALRREAVVTLAGMGVAVKYAHAENGHVEPDESDPHLWEQHEIELRLEPLPRAADAALLTVWVLENLARRQGWRCTLAPIVREGHVGSGMHVHCSPVVDGQPLAGSGSDGSMPRPAQALIGGLTRMGGALMAFGNRDRSSFVRLHQGIEAPSTVTWGRSDRKALIRLPIVARDDHGRALTPPTVEFRLPDGSAHPHLLLAGIAQAFSEAHARHDLEQQVERTRSDGADAAQLVPRGFGEVADELLARRDVLEAGGVFPAHLLERMAADLRARES